MKQFRIKNTAKISYILFVLLFTASLTLSTSCAPKTGCKATEGLGPDIDENGNIKTKKRGKTKLFRN